MRDDIIKGILIKNKIKHKETKKSFIIPKEIAMDSKAPKWFQEFEKRNNARFDTLEAKVDKNTEMIIENREMILENRKMILKNHKMILKAHPEFDE